MRQEVKLFFEDKNLQIEKLIDIGHKKNLTPDSVIEAAEQVYDEIENGMEIEQIRIAWRVYEKARTIAPRQAAFKDDTVKKLHDLMVEYTTPWYKKVWRKFNDSSQ